MAITKEKKKKIVEDAESKIKDAGSVVFVGFNGLSVGESTAMRGKFREEGAFLTVVKKTLLRRALQGLNISGEAPSLDGQVFIVHGDDVVAPSKLVAKFVKEFSGKLSVFGGILEGRFLSSEEAVALSMIPSRIELYGQLVNVINSPIQGTVSVLSGITRNFVSVLDQIAKTVKS